MIKYCSLFFCLLFLLAGCSSYRANSFSLRSDASQFYQVKAGDTLYSIAWHYGRDYRELAHLNNIVPPYKIKIGQHLKLTQQIIKSTKYNLSAPATDSIKTWLWPVKGRVISRFLGKSGMNKGIDIAARPGSPVKATAAGKVVYSGGGLRGYGELIIIKHNNEFLSAYAHNKKLFVHEGESVSAGQVIAQVGNSDAKRVLLHFEIRKAGKPVNPLNYLPKSG